LRRGGMRIYLGFEDTDCVVRNGKLIRLVDDTSLYLERGSAIRRFFPYVPASLDRNCGDRLPQNGSRNHQHAFARENIPRATLEF
jgi:hypothetical protein